MGCFLPFIIITFLVIIHELGHFIAALYFKFDIDKIYLYPYGGISKFNLKMNVDLNKELIVLVLGPIFQFIAYFILINIPYMYSYHELIKDIHYTIIFFNLLPIYPLDGGKLLNIIFNYFYSFKKSIKTEIYVSYIITLIIFIYYIKTSITLNVLFMIFFLIYKITYEKNNINNYYEKFLLERYLNNYRYKKHITVNSINDFYRNRNHLIKNNKRYISEKEALNNKFNNKY